MTDSEIAAPAQALVVPKATRGRPWGLVVLAAAILAAVGGAKAWERGYRPQMLWQGQAVPLETTAVDRGDLALLVVETGTLESADNATVKCQVEALIGSVGGAQSKSGGGGGGRTNSSGSARAVGGAATKKGAAGAPAGTTKAAGKGGAATVTAGAGGSVSSGGESPGGGGGGGASTGIQRPNIRSFSYVVTPHMPLRGSNSSGSAPRTGDQPGGQQGGGGERGGGGGGGGRGGGRGGSSMGEEKAGSTRIIWILPEGTPVKPGDVVCELDSADFRDELQAQRIKVGQAKAWLDQATSMVEVNEISLREFREGISPQDLQLLRQYLTTCRIDLERAEDTLEWSRQMYEKKFRAKGQLEADENGFKRSQIALDEGRGMERRLETYTRPRLLKSLEAKIAASRADMLAQKSAFKIESDRLRRLEATVGFCTMRAPREGIVVYVSATNSWGRSENRIQEGVTVREGQAIFSVPNTRNMRVRARINESKVSLVHTGQAAEIRVDAFPQRPLRGTVAEVMPIPAPSNGPMSDTKIYNAIVNIDRIDFEGLRPGLSAEIAMKVDTQQAVTRVPVEAVRWFRDEAYVARPKAGGPGWGWHPVTLGGIDTTHAEVLAGLEPGDRVIAQPKGFPAPSASPTRLAASALARRAPRPEG